MVCNLLLTAVIDTLTSYYDGFLFSTHGVWRIINWCHFPASTTHSYGELSIQPRKNLKNLSLVRFYS